MHGLNEPMACSGCLVHIHGCAAMARSLPHEVKPEEAFER